MFFFPDKKTPVLFQGITSTIGRRQTELAIKYGTNLVAGTTHQGEQASFTKNIPIFSSVKKVVRSKKIKVSVIFSTPNQALNDVLEAVQAKIPLIICTTEHVPMHDALKMQLAAKKKKVTLLGPSSAGILNVGNCFTGTIPPTLFQKGNIAIIGRSSSLIFEAAQQLESLGLGVSKCVSLGADHLIATSFVPILESLFQDNQTKAILVIGQSHGLLENELAEFYKKRHPKKVFVYIPGKTVMRSDKAPLLGMKSVLFSEIISQKKDLLTKSNIKWIDSCEKIGTTIYKEIKGRKK